MIRCKAKYYVHTDGSVKTISCLSAVDTSRLVLSLFRARAVMSCPSESGIEWKTCQKCIFRKKRADINMNSTQEKLRILSPSTYANP